MSEIKYGRESKKIVFYDSDKRHAELKVRLKHDSLTQAEFFRTLITGYLDKDENVLSFLDKYILKNDKQSNSALNKNRKLIDDGREVERKFALSNDEIESIFDILAEEHPEL